MALGVTKESERSYVVDASANVRQLNRVMNWNLPTDGPKTLNGLIVEQLAEIPESGTGVTVANYPIEILDASEHGIKKVRVFAPGASPPPKVAAGRGRERPACASAVDQRERFAHTIDSRTLHLERAPRHVGARHHRTPKPVLLSLEEPLPAARPRPHPPPDPDLP